MTKKRLILTLVGLLIGGCLSTNAQQDAQFSMFMFNQMYFNPAYAGADGQTRIQIQNRWQWMAYQATFDEGGGPNTLMASASVPLNFIKSAVGLHYVNDRIGPSGSQEVQLSYAYKLNINDNALSLGARVGFYNRYLDFGKLRPRDTGDPLIVSGRVAQTRPDISIGALYDATTFYVGISANHLNQAQFPFGATTAKNTLSPNIYLMGGYRWYPLYELEIQPMALVKTESSFNTKTMSVEAGVMANYNESIFGGVNYRLQDALIVFLGKNLLDDRLRIGASWDITFSGLEAKAPGSLEVFMSYSLPAPRFGRKSIVRTPRFRY
jgi:type IX secretion system PorP/SprF family membrane protein